MERAKRDITQLSKKSKEIGLMTRTPEGSDQTVRRPKFSWRLLCVAGRKKLMSNARRCP
jgi:hypothetical protein